MYCSTGCFSRKEKALKQQIYNTALYLRLSRDDDVQGESGSISTQRQMLADYCREQGLHIYSEYVDDGYSGTNYDRPGFQRMLDDIEDGKVNCVITKDLSRLGRNYVLTGQYTDIYFPSHNVRYIALADGVDSVKGESEIAPFLNILNEMHARQTSKKVKAALHTKFANGAHYGAYAPLGYQKHPEIKGKLIIDTEYRWIVEKIFDLAAHGKGGAVISRSLTEKKVPTPAWIKFQRDGTFAHIFRDQPESKRYQWTTAQVKAILSDEVYLGHSIHNRQSSISFKNKKKVRKAESEWFKVENTHEPIISQELWDQAQVHIQSRKRPQKNGETQIFAGLLKCADCGWGLRYMHNRSTEKTKERRLFTCTTYSEYGKDRCSIHYIKYDTVYAIVLARLQYWIGQAHADENKLLDRILQSGDKQRNAEVEHAKKDLAKTEKRLKELDNLFAKLYEDRVNNTVSERNYAMLSSRYQDEQVQLEARVAALRDKVNQMVQGKDNAEKWISLIRRYTNLTELTAPLLNELIDKIVVHEATKDDNGRRLQDVDIYYRFVGKIE